MDTIRVPCGHKTEGTPSHVVIPDYHPLTRDEIKMLLDLASKDDDQDLQCEIVDRLCQGIKGMVCPFFVAESGLRRKEIKLTAYFMMHYREGGTEELVSQIESILNE